MHLQKLYILALSFLTFDVSFSAVSNNAGVMAPPFMLSKDNIEMQFATNHLGI